jgi:hypothetical protein
MSARARSSSLRFEKRRVRARIHLTSGDLKEGHFFVAGGSSRHDGPERVGDVLNEDGGFVPFEVQDSAGTRTALINRSHILMVKLAEDEARRDAGYVVAPQHLASMRLSNGLEITGLVRVYRPEGHDRLSDWTREPETFRYVETDAGTLLVNTAHIIEVSEAPES